MHVPSSVAALIYVIGIAGLFYLDRDVSVRPSKALWLPIIWLGFNGTRPLSAWLGINMASVAQGQLPSESRLDQAVAGGLILFGAIVVIRRRGDVRGLLRASWPILLYFLYALVSLSWSDYPVWGLKRWVRSWGDVIMVLIVVTDARPTAALRRLFSRLGFILLPTSLLLIKYYPVLGTSYDAWGARENTGLTTDKNMLGVMVFIVTLGTLWQVLTVLRDREQPNRKRRLLAQSTLLAFGIDLLFTAHSATSGACFILGAGLVLALTLPLFRRRPQAVHALVLAVLLGGGVAYLLGAEPATVRALGREPDLSQRTLIWKNLIPLAPNPIGGAGFETFWIGPRVETFCNELIMTGAAGCPHESHDGYIEMYLQLGWIGLGLIALILAQGYRRAVGAFRHNPALGALLVAYVVTAVTYNITEAGFRMLDLGLFFLLLSIVAANRFISLGEVASELPHELPDLTPVVRGIEHP